MNTTERLRLTKRKLRSAQARLSQLRRELRERPPADHVYTKLYQGWRGGSFVEHVLKVALNQRPELWARVEEMVDEHVLKRIGTKG
jgi:hypothetical protein